MTAMTMPIQNGHAHGIEKIYWNEDVLEALRNIPQHETIALFTPVVPHYRGPAAQGQECPEDMDPFECFGRALSNYHRPITHVPYQPSKCFENHHYYWMKRVSGVIVVTCEPWGNDREACNEAFLEQQDFSATIADVAEHFAESQPDIPVVIVKCGIEWNQEVDDRVCSIEIPDYSAGSLQVAAHFLYYGE